MTLAHYDFLREWDSQIMEHSFVEECSSLMPPIKKNGKAEQIAKIMGHKCPQWWCTPMLNTDENVFITAPIVAVMCKQMPYIVNVLVDNVPHKLVSTKYLPVGTTFELHISDKLSSIIYDINHSVWPQFVKIKTIHIVKCTTMLEYYTINQTYSMDDDDDDETYVRALIVKNWKKIAPFNIKSYMRPFIVVRKTSEIPDVYRPGIRIEYSHDFEVFDIITRLSLRKYIKTLSHVVKNIEYTEGLCDISIISELLQCRMKEVIGILLWIGYSMNTISMMSLYAGNKVLYNLAELNNIKNGQ